MTEDKEKKLSEAELRQEIIDRFDGETVATGEAIPMPEQNVFDDDILEQNIIIKSIKTLGEREGKYGVTTDYLIGAIHGETGEELNIRTNHSWVFGVIYRLEKYKRPFKARLRKSKGGRFFMTGWITQEKVL